MKINTAYVTFLGREFVNTSLYNYALAIAFLIVAIIFSLLSSIADYHGNKKSFMNFFLTMGSLACLSLFFLNTTDGKISSGVSNPWTWIIISDRLPVLAIGAVLFIIILFYRK
jgi:MFS-type transporter involved in bile tolerance (Atg22 family)